MAAEKSCIEILSEPITLPCGLTLPNRLVKCPMQETLASPPTYDPPIESFSHLYDEWAGAKYGLLITGQVQVDLRYFSVAGDVAVHEGSLEEPILGQWKKWAEIAQQHGTPCIVQLAHPGRMSPAGAGVRPADMPALCASSVPVKMGDTWLDKLALDKLLGTPKAMTIEEIDEAVNMWVRGALVAKKAGFAGIQLHGAHGFLLSQFLSPHTNRRTDDYGGTPEKRMKFLKRLVTEVREKCPAPFCVSVKLNSADYMESGGLTQEEALEQVRWLCECGMVDFVEISGGNAEQKNSGLHNSFSSKSASKPPPAGSSTALREAFYTQFCTSVHTSIRPSIPIQLSGGFRSRTGAATAITTSTCDLIGLGRSAVLQPTLPRSILLNPDVPDDEAIALSHQVRGQWLVKWFPVKVVGSGFVIEFFYWNMRRLGRGVGSDPNASIITVLGSNIYNALSKKAGELTGGWWPGVGGRVKSD